MSSVSPVILLISNLLPTETAKCRAWPGAQGRTWQKAFRHYLSAQTLSPHTGARPCAYSLDLRSEEKLA